MISSFVRPGATNKVSPANCQLAAQTSCQLCMLGNRILSLTCNLVPLTKNCYKIHASILKNACKCMKVAGIIHKLVARIGADFHALTIELLELQNSRAVFANRAWLTILVAPKSSKWGLGDLHWWLLLHKKSQQRAASADKSYTPIANPITGHGRV